jgi:integrase
VFGAKAKELNELNKHLDKLEQAVIDFSSERHNSKSLNREDLKAHIKRSQIDERKTLEDQLEKESDFFSVWKKLIETTKTPTGKNITASTKKNKLSNLNLVKKYCIDRKLKLTFGDFDMNFYHDFDSFMQEKGIDHNTRGRHFKDIKAILRAAFDRDIPVNLAFQKRSFKVIRSATESIYLNEEELRKLLKIKLSSALEKQRDIFVMACFVGARHSDWHQIRDSNIINENGKEILMIDPKKTGEIYHIPVHTVVRMILNKYGGDPPKVISNQKFNGALKEICKHEDAKLGRVIIGGKQVEKWTLISTHSARRSFATNAYLSRSLDVYQIMKCTGHRTEASFLIYLKLNGKDFAMEAADSKFFNNESWMSLSVAS